MPKNRANTSNAPPPQDCGKWIDLRGVDNCLSSVARLSLDDRLSAVRYYLPLAALRADETREHVHRLRVSTRRVLAALELYKDLLPRQKAKWMRGQMKQIRRAAGEARDLDVLAERYEASDSRKHKRLLKGLKRLRNRSQRSIVRLNRKLTDSRKLEKRSAKLLAGIRCDPGLTLKEFARSRLRDQAAQFFNSAESNLKKVHQLHRFRIQAKALRYTIELLHDVLPKEVRSKVYPVVCKTQDLLGELNDHSNASQRLKRLSRKEDCRRESRRLMKLCRKETRKIGEMRRAFYAWWTCEFASEFKQQLEELLEVHCGRGGGTR